MARHETTLKSWSALRPLGWRGLGRQIPCAHAPVSSLHAGGLCCDGSRDPPRFVNCLSLRRRPGTVYSPASGGVRLVTSVTGCVRTSGPDHVSASGLSTHPRRGPKAIRASAPTNRQAPGTPGWIKRGAVATIAPRTRTKCPRKPVAGRRYHDAAHLHRVGWPVPPKTDHL